MKTRKRKIADSYMALIHKFPLRPIRSQSEYDEATAIAEHLYLRDENDLDAGERDYLDGLDEFISAFDDKHFKLDGATTPHQRLKYILAESETSPTALKEILGCSQSLVSMVISGERELSKENIRVLAGHFRVDAGYFL